MAAGVSLAAQYRQAQPGYRYEFPRDHFDHPEFQTEWWYYTGNLRAGDGHRFGFELTFFRQAVNRTPRPGESPWAVHDVYLAHLALSDLDGGTFLHEERVNRAGPGLAGIDAGSGVIWNGNWRVRMKSEAPGPAARGEASAPHSMRRAALTQSLEAVTDRLALHLSLDSSKPPVIIVVNGVSQKAAGPGQASHYISLTRLLASGRVEVGGRSYDVEGSAWMDHEFFTNQLGRDQRGWDWLSLQLDDGSDLMVYRLRRSDGSADPFSAGTLVSKDGVSTHLAAMDFSMVATGERWTSPQTKATYPISWRVSLPSRGLELEVRTPLPSQELSGGTGWTPTYWEGAVTASSRVNGKPITGVGYLELTGYDKAVVLAPRAASHKYTHVTPGLRASGSNREMLLMPAR
jgi:predicted secreted hydrolase